ncbi:hypothetical protein [Salinactinospora qingdaonensis]|uniref:Uncharacterized protein n=1 Tax=Salinactinospora qingdaonensis TaxID=702744 RepID=A0ABP7FAS7_9ACTN
MLKKLREAGITSDMAYAAGFCSIGLTILAWFASRSGGDRANTARAERWGLFIGEWAPTFMALGVGLKLEEQSTEE